MARAIAHYPFDTALDDALEAMTCAEMAVIEAHPGSLNCWPRHDVLTCPASTHVGYVERGHITQSHIEGAGQKTGYRKSHQSAEGSGAGWCRGLEPLWRLYWVGCAQVPLDDQQQHYALADFPTLESSPLRSNRGICAVCSATRYELCL